MSVLPHHWSSSEFLVNPLPSNAHLDLCRVNLRDAFSKLNGDKTYKKLMVRIGENTEYMDGPDYDKIRPVNQEAYRGLVKKISGQ